MKALLDTNFLLIPGKDRVDIFRELRRFGKPDTFTLDLVVEELERLSRGRGKDASHARLALGLIESKGVRVLEARGSSADDELVRLARDEGYAVCTQDRELQGRLREEGADVVLLRQGRTLERM